VLTVDLPYENHYRILSGKIDSGGGIFRYSECVQHAKWLRQRCNVEQIALQYGLSTRQFFNAADVQLQNQ
jgi:hypothetical protein